MLYCYLERACFPSSVCLSLTQSSGHFQNEAQLNPFHFVADKTTMVKKKPKMVQVIVTIRNGFGLTPIVKQCCRFVPLSALLLFYFLKREKKDGKILSCAVVVVTTIYKERKKSYSAFLVHMGFAHCFFF